MFPWTAVTSNAATAASAVIWKRSWLSSSAASVTPPSSSSVSAGGVHAGTNAPVIRSPAVLFELISSIMSGGNQDERMQATLFLSTLTSEINGTQKNMTNLNQTMDFHKRSHAMFFKNGLNQTVQIAMSSLSAVLADPVSISSDLSCKIVGLVLDVLAWEFTPNNVWSLFVSDAMSVIKPPPNFAVHFIQPNLLHSIFGAYAAVKGTCPALAHTLRQLVLSLSSITGPIFCNETVRTDYATCILEGVACILSSSSTEPSELHDIASICTRLVSNFKVKVLSSIASFPNLLSSLVSLLNSLLSSVASSVEQHGGDFDCLDDDWKFEAFDSLLECFVLLVEDFTLLDPSFRAIRVR